MARVQSTVILFHHGGTDLLTASPQVDLNTLLALLALKICALLHMIAPINYVEHSLLNHGSTKFPQEGNEAALSLKGPCSPKLEFERKRHKLKTSSTLPLRTDRNLELMATDLGPHHHNNPIHASEKPRRLY